MENKDYNRELAKYIWSVLRMQIAIFISWGVNPESMKVIEGGLEFHCLGFKHTGNSKNNPGRGSRPFRDTSYSRF